MVFPKKLHWNMIFLISLGKMIYLFLENTIFFFRRRMKDELPKKNTEICYILQIFWKKWFFKKFLLEYDLSSIIRKDGIFFTKIWYFFYGWDCISIRLLHRGLSANFAKFLRTPFLTKHLWWLLLEVQLGT